MTKAKKGFTLIEIVIVLAIAALILVIVFLAVAGANRAQRDNAVKSAAARMLAGVQQYASNHSGSYPSTDAEVQDVAKNYQVNLPSTIKVTDVTFGDGPASLNKMEVNNKPCTGTSGASVWYWQENGGSVCVGT